MGNFDNRLPRRNVYAAHRHLWATLLSAIFGIHCSAATFIGNPSAANGWSTTNAVKVRAGHERTSPPSLDSRLAISTIDGSGLDAAGEIHSVDQTKMWLSQLYTFQGNPPDPAGRYRLRRPLDRVRFRPAVSDRRDADLELRGTSG